MICWCRWPIWITRPANYIKVTSGRSGRSGVVGGHWVGALGGTPRGAGRVTVGEEPDTIEEVYEPDLIMEGYLNRTPQGRVATELSYQKTVLDDGGGEPAETIIGPLRNS